MSTAVVEMNCFGTKIGLQFSPNFRSNQKCFVYLIFMSVKLH